MKGKRTKLLFSGIIVILCVAAGYFFAEVKQLRKSLGSLQQTQVSDSILLVHQRMWSLDSLLFTGDYKQSLKAFKEQKQKLPANLNGFVEERIKLLSKLLQYSRKVDDSIDSTALQNEALKEALGSKEVEIGVYDSIAFALRKANLQIKNLQKQIKQKSAGEYLTFKSSKGSKVHYVGEVRNGQANGKGFGLLETGSRYEGEWKNNMRDGQGAFYWPDGEYYIGQYKNDERQGKGQYFWPNGDIFTGDWLKDKRNGNGSFYNAEEGVTTNGIWKNDELVEVIK